MLTFLKTVLSACIILSSLKIELSRGALSGEKWPSKKISYAFSDLVDFNLNSRRIVEITLKEIEKQLSYKDFSCIQFLPKQIEDTDYILFVDKGVCSSSVGYRKGVNQVSLAKSCLNTGTIMHEIMHRLGFYHEHSRGDRDENIQVFKNNIKDLHHNFETNHNIDDFDSSPYDFLSITHYNSNAMPIDENKPTLLAKFPSLISKNHKLNIERSGFSKIDILQIQKLYECKQIERPQITQPIAQVDLDLMMNVMGRLKHEALFVGTEENTIEKYIEKSVDKCGMNHYWNLNYPIVTSDHKHYEFFCEEKRSYGKTCQFSIQCAGLDSSCFRMFFKKNGFCFRTKNIKINKIGQTINDQMFKKGKIIKEESVKTKEKLDSVAKTSVDLLKTSFKSLKKIFG